jgi:thioredoxin-like negative regulator of GroEL
MRLFVACLLLAVAPIAAVIAYKEYELEHRNELPVNWHSRGEVLFFNASWCGPCRQMKPIVASLRREGYRLRDIDVDSHRELAQKYGISAVPTFVFVENGGEVDRFSGGTSAEHLRQLCSGPAYR